MGNEALCVRLTIHSLKGNDQKGRGLFNLTKEDGDEGRGTATVPSAMITAEKRELGKAD